MGNQYEEMRQNLMEQYDRTEQCRNVMDTLEMKLPNDSEKTDYSEWRQASIRVAKDNETLLKAMMK